MARGEKQLSRIHLVRHGQAGSRHAYDALSALGREQARLFGAFLASQPLEFAAAFTGTLARQEQTAAEAKAEYESIGRPFPALAVDCGWNEFDLPGIYEALAPQLCAADAAFRKEYEELMRQALQPQADVHRRWTSCDIRVVNTWIEGRYRYEGESWPAFRERVLACQERLERFGREENVLVFTSATPIGIWSAAAMDIADARALRLAGALLNSSCSVIRIGSGTAPSIRLHSFNVASHLSRPELFTYR